MSQYIMKGTKDKLSFFTLWLRQAYVSTLPCTNNDQYVDDINMLCILSPLPYKNINKTNQIVKFATISFKIMASFRTAAGIY